jgi:mannose-6-phosphate isomerase-like protein (cupin superfamily)
VKLRADPLHNSSYTRLDLAGASRRSLRASRNHAINQGGTQMSTATPRPSLEGWDITRADDAEWIPWGQDGNARAKILGQADGYTVVLVEAHPRYQGTPHHHDYAEFFYLVDGHVRNDGQELHDGDGYAAAGGSTHDDFSAITPSTYLSIFRI